MARFKVIIEMEVEASGKLDAGAIAFNRIVSGGYNGKSLEEIGCKLRVQSPRREQKQKSNKRVYVDAHGNEY